MSNQITFTVVATAENKSLIEDITSLMVKNETNYDKGIAIAELNIDYDKEHYNKVTNFETRSEIDTGTSMTELKAAAKASKNEHGEHFTMQVLKNAGVKTKTTLGKSLSAVDTDRYATIVAAWEAGPTSAVLETDYFDDEVEVSPDSIVMALKAYAKENGREEAKEIMNSNGASALSKVGGCTPKQLAAMMKALV